MKLIFLGPPGAGKGTMAKRLASHGGMAHISTGDLFREAVAQGTDLGKQVKSILDRGDLVPDEVTVKLVQERIGRPDCRRGFILDGFPRTIPQAEALDRLSPPDLAVNFVLADDEVVKRLSGRRLCPSCGKTFHILFVPPRKPDICDGCGTGLVIRKDDQVEAIRNRLAVYKAQTEPLEAHYRDLGILRNIDAAPDPEKVFAALKTALGV